LLHGVTDSKEALDTKADVIATSCPFCLLMLTDGCKKFTEEQKAYDIAELVASLSPIGTHENSPAIYCVDGDK